MKDLYIFGTSLFSKIMKYYLEESGIVCKGYLVEKAYFDSNLKLDLPVFCYDNFTSQQKREIKCLIAIGYNKMNSIRMKIYQRLISDGVEIISFIHKSANISKNVECGEGCIILENAIIQPFVKLGICNIIWSGVNICHDTAIGDFNFFAASSTVLGGISIGDYNFFGSNCTIKNGINIGSKNLVGACVFLNENIDNDSTYITPKFVKLIKKSNEVII